MLISAVFFDYDGVLTMDKTGSQTTAKFISQELNIPYRKIEKAIKRRNSELTLGEITYNDIWLDFCSEIGREVDIGILKNAFASTPKNNKMFELAGELKKYYKIGIITDNKKDRIDLLKGQQKLDILFDSIIVSAEIGSDKSDSRIFDIALQKFNVKPKNCIFIDNQEKNLIVPREMGFVTILHDDSINNLEYLKNKLKKYEY